MPEAVLWIERPRDVNEVGGLAAFIEAWDRPSPPHRRKRYKYNTSEAGHINDEGHSDSLSAPAIPYWHPQFRSALEVGVAPIVVLLTSKGRWISYTSCEGHYYPTSPERSCERHVGLLPRTAQERSLLTSLLERAIEIVSPVTHAVQPKLAASIVTDRDHRREGVELYFARPTSAPWQDYFRNVDASTEALVGALKTVL